MSGVTIILFVKLKKYHYKEKYPILVWVIILKWICLHQCNSVIQNYFLVCLKHTKKNICTPIAKARHQGCPVQFVHIKHTENMLRKKYWQALKSVSVCCIDPVVEFSNFPRHAPHLTSPSIFQALPRRENYACFSSGSGKERMFSS